MEWKWTDEDLGWAYVRYVDKSTRNKVPVNFIKNFKKGDTIVPNYQYKVFWSEDKERSTPIQYLQSASSIPEFESEEPVTNFGDPGCYRAVVYAIKSSLKELEQWIVTTRVREAPNKLLFTSFDVPKPKSQPSTSRKVMETGETSQNTSSKGTVSANKGRKSSKEAKRKGTLRNADDLRKNILAAADLKEVMDGSLTKHDKKSPPKKAEDRVPVPKEETRQPNTKKTHLPKEVKVSEKPTKEDSGPKKEKHERSAENEFDPLTEKGESNKELEESKIAAQDCDDKVEEVRKPKKRAQSEKKEVDPSKVGGQTEKNKKVKEQKITAQSGDDEIKGNRKPKMRPQSGGKDVDPLNEIGQNERNNKLEEPKVAAQDESDRMKNGGSKKEEPKRSEERDVDTSKEEYPKKEEKKLKKPDMVAQDMETESGDEKFEGVVNPAMVMGWMDEEEENIDNPDPELSREEDDGQGVSFSKSKNPNILSSEESESSKSSESCEESSDSSDSEDSDSSSNNDLPVKKRTTGTVRKETDSDDEQDPSITSPRKVKKMECTLSQNRQELLRSAKIKDRLREENNRLRELLEKAGLGGSLVGIPEVPVEEPPTHAETSKSNHNAKGLSKRKQREEAMELKRKRITTLVDIPEKYDFENVKAFKISDEYQVSKEVLESLWGITGGEAKDALFVKEAAVHIFGSDTLVRVGVVKGIKVNGVQKMGLDKAALEGIRVLLILRAQREGVQVLYDTKRTKQSRVNGFITDKIKALNVSALLRAQKAAKQQKPAVVEP